MKTKSQKKNPSESLVVRLDQFPERREMGLGRIAEDFGGRTAFLDIARMSDKVEVQEFVRLADHFTNTDLTKLCEQAGISAPDLLAHMVHVMYFYGNNVARLLSAMDRPNVMKASLKAAKDPDGIEDRKLQFEMAGMLPKKGPLVNVNVNSGGRSASEEMLHDAEIEGETIDVLAESEPEADPSSRAESSEEGSTVQGDSSDS